MAKQRFQVAYHFQVDPAEMTPGLVRLPEQITRTIACGEEIVKTEKVSSACLAPADREALIAELEKQVAEATRTARPAGAAAAALLPGESEEEMSAI